MALFSWHFSSRLLRKDSRKDERAHARMQKHKLALDSAICFLDLPVASDEGPVQTVQHPFLLPHILAGGLCVYGKNYALHSDLVR